MRASADDLRGGPERLPQGRAGKAWAVGNDSENPVANRARREGQQARAVHPA